jgi:hypothetical protein
MQPRIRSHLSVSRETRHRSAYISVSFNVVEPIAGAAVDAGNAGAAIPASFLPKESLRLEKVEGNHSDRTVQDGPFVDPSCVACFWVTRLRRFRLGA